MEIKVSQWILPLASILCALILGIIFEKIILIKLKKISAKTKWEGDEIFVTFLRGKTFLWFIIAGIYFSTISLPITSNFLVPIQKVLLIVAIISATSFVANTAVGLINLYAKKTGNIFSSISIFTNVTRLLIFLIGILIMLQSLGISIAPILTALGVGGLAVALALQDTLSNLFSGFQILASMQIKPGDYVKLGSGEEGYIMDTTWRNTIIKSLSNNMIVVPNSKLASSVVTNYHLLEKETSIFVIVEINSSNDFDKIEKTTLEAAKEVMREVHGGIPEFEPVIRYNAIESDSISFTVILRVREFTEQYLIKHEFIKRLYKRCATEGLKFKKVG